MEGFSDGTSTVMRQIVAAFQVPVIVLLLLGMVFIVICIGSLVGEYLTEHRKFKVFLPSLVDDLKNSPDGQREVIKRSGLLLRQKQCLIELTKHPDITDAMRESLAVGLEYHEQKRYDGIVKITDVLSRVAPMLGLLGTLIPLGPGIMALGTGETLVLSQSLLIAFDTTSLGLIIGGLALVVSAIRNRWYKEYMVNFDAAIECVLEVEKSDSASRSGAFGDVEGEEDAEDDADAGAAEDDEDDEGDDADADAAAAAEDDDDAEDAEDAEGDEDDEGDADAAEDDPSGKEGAL
jgi:biopolymer transport protein ExbB/TolQ